MPSATVTGQCPHWCAREHAAGTCGTAFYHASETSSVTISRPDGCSVPDRLDVQTAQYLPDDPGEPAWSPTVEIAVHAGGRYRLIGLTPEEARDLAVVLARAADLVSIPRGKQPPRRAEQHLPVGRPRHRRDQHGPGHLVAGQPLAHRRDDGPRIQPIQRPVAWLDDRRHPLPEALIRQPDDDAIIHRGQRARMTRAAASGRPGPGRPRGRPATRWVRLVAGAGKAPRRDSGGQMLSQGGRPCRRPSLMPSRVGEAREMT